MDELKSRILCVLDKAGDCGISVDPLSRLAETGLSNSRLKTILDEMADHGLCFRTGHKYFKQGASPNGRHYRTNLSRGKVYMFNLVGHLLKEFQTVNEAAKHASMMSNCMSAAISRTTIVGGKWYFSRLRDFSPVSAGVKIWLYDLEGKLAATFASYTACGRFIGVCDFAVKIHASRCSPIKDTWYPMLKPEFTPAPALEYWLHDTEAGGTPCKFRSMSLVAAEIGASKQRVRQVLDKGKLIAGRWAVASKKPGDINAGPRDIYIEYRHHPAMVIPVTRADPYTPLDSTEEARVMEVLMDGKPRLISEVHSEAGFEWKQVCSAMLVRKMAQGRKISKMGARYWIDPKLSENNG